MHLTMNFFVTKSRSKVGHRAQMIYSRLAAKYVNQFFSIGEVQVAEICEKPDVKLGCACQAAWSNEGAIWCLLCGSSVVHGELGSFPVIQSGQTENHKFFQ